MNMLTQYDHKLATLCNSCRFSSLCLPMSMNEKPFDNIDTLVTQRPLLHKNDVLYREHEKFTSLYVVRSGCIKTHVLTENGQERITGFYLAGDIIGIGGFSDDQYHNSAIATTTASLCKIPFDEWETLSNQIPDLQRNLLKAMSRKILMDQETMLILNQKKSEERIAAFLLSLSARFGRDNISPLQFALPMSRGEIGNFLGLTIESVSRSFSSLRQQGIINIDRRQLEINNINQLKEIADPEVKTIHKELLDTSECSY